MAPSIQEELEFITATQLKNYESGPWILNDLIEPKNPRSPGQWFSKMFPNEAKIYGPPFLEAKTATNRNYPLIVATHINVEFFASLLGARKDFGHDVIYYEPECQFYYREPGDGLYRTTSEEKLMSLLGLYLIRCAQDMAPNVDQVNLFVNFRGEEQLRAVIKKARSLLGADESFFSLDSPNQRIAGPETHGKAAKMFIHRSIEANPERKITVTEAFEAFRAFCDQQGLMLVDRRHFKALVSEIINDEFGISLRHDIPNQSGRHQNGWVGLGLKPTGLEMAARK